MKKLIFTLLIFISAQLQSQNVSKNSKNSYAFNNALKQFVGFCIMEVNISDQTETNIYSKAYVANGYTEFCITLLELKEEDMPYLSKSRLKEEVEKVLSDDIIKNKFLKNLSKMGACDEQRISFLISPPANDDRYFAKVSYNDAQILSQYVLGHFCNSSISSDDANAIDIQTQQDVNKSGLYKVIANKAFFYIEPQEATKKSSYLIKGNKVVIKNYKGNFGYVEYRNTQGKITKGWLKLSDISLIEEDAQAITISKQQKEEEIRQQKMLLEQQRIAETLKKAEQERLLREAEEKKAREQVASIFSKEKIETIDSKDTIDNLKSRTWIRKPNVYDNSGAQWGKIGNDQSGKTSNNNSLGNNILNKTGKVVIDIKVDREGNITYAKYQPNGSTTTDEYLIQLSEKAALKAKFNPDPKAPEEAKGTISFKFDNQE